MTRPDSHIQHTRSVLRLGLPLIGGHLAQFAIGLTDTIMVGWYGVPELAALTIAGSLFFTLFLFGSGFAWAIMPMVARFAAMGDDVKVRRATRMALWLSGIYALSVLPLLWFSGSILRALGQTEIVAEMAQLYLRVLSFGLFPALGVMVLKNYLAGLEHTRVVLWITVAAAFANVLVNYVLIFGHWGAPEMGIVGAAVASLTVQIVSLILVTVYAVRKLPEHDLFVRFWKPDWEMFGEVFHLGWPIGLTTLAEVGLFAASSVLMGWLGTIPLAAHGIALQISTASFMVQIGLANAATVAGGGCAWPGRCGQPHARRAGGRRVGCGRGCDVGCCFLADARYPVGVVHRPGRHTARSHNCRRPGPIDDGGTVSGGGRGAGDPPGPVAGFAGYAHTHDHGGLRLLGRRHAKCVGLWVCYWLGRRGRLAGACPRARRLQRSF